MKITAKSMTRIQAGDDIIQIPESEIIRVIMYLHPIIYDNSEVILGAVIKKGKTYHTTVNPNRVINGPLSAYGEELESPIEQEYRIFVQDCKLVIKDFGFTIIKEYTSQDSKKSEYIVVYGLEGKPCGTLIFEIRISDHPFDVKFPEELKDEVVEYLNMNKVMNDEAFKAGIDFQVEKVTIGSVSSDTWDRALNRLFNVLRKMKKSIDRRLKLRGN